MPGKVDVVVEPGASVVVVAPPPVVEVDDADVPAVVGVLDDVVDEPPGDEVLDACDVVEPSVVLVEHAATRAPAINTTSVAMNGRTDRERTRRAYGGLRS